MGFPRKEYWSRFPFPSPEDLPHPGTEFASSALAGRLFTTEPRDKPYFLLVIFKWNIATVVRKILSHFSKTEKEKMYD